MQRHLSQSIFTPRGVHKAFMYFFMSKYVNVLFYNDKTWQNIGNRDNAFVTIGKSLVESNI